MSKKMIKEPIRNNIVSKMVTGFLFATSLLQMETAIGQNNTSSTSTQPLALKRNLEQNDPSKTSDYTERYFSEMRKKLEVELSTLTLSEQDKFESGLSEQNEVTRTKLKSMMLGKMGVKYAPKNWVFVGSYLQYLYHSEVVEGNYNESNHYQLLSPSLYGKAKLISFEKWSLWFGANYVVNAFEYALIQGRDKTGAEVSLVRYFNSLNVFLGISANRFSKDENALSSFDTSFFTGLEAQLKEQYFLGVEGSLGYKDQQKYQKSISNTEQVEFEIKERLMGRVNFYGNYRINNYIAIAAEYGLTHFGEGNYLQRTYTNGVLSSEESDLEQSSTISTFSLGLKILI